MSNSTDRIPVLVTGVGGGGHGSQILKALRLADTPYDIVCCDISSESWGLAGEVDPHVVPRANDPGFLDAIFALCRKHGIQVVLHGSEPELKIFSEHRDRFRDLNILLPINRQDVIRTCMDKVKTAEAIEELGYPVPPFREIHTVEEAAEFEHFPAVLKPSVGGGGSANLFLAQTRDELVAFAQHLLASVPHFVVQAYVGSVHEEYTVGVLHDLDGQFINSIAVRRRILPALSNHLRVVNRSGRQELGPILAISNGVSQGDIGPFPDVTGPCENIAGALGSCGPMNLQCRRVGAEVHVFEINPRFSGTTSLRAMVGYNEPDILIRRHLLNEDIPPRFPYRSGLILRGLEERLIEGSSS